MTLLWQYDFDPRKWKKDYGSVKDNERDWRDFEYQHQIELHYEAITRRDLLHHYFPVRAWDLMLALKRLYFLGSEDLSRIMKFLLYNDKFVEVEEMGEDERYWNLYLFPRIPILIKHPHSLLPISYYEKMRNLS